MSLVVVAKLGNNLIRSVCANANKFVDVCHFVRMVCTGDGNKVPKVSLALLIKGSVANGS